MEKKLTSYTLGITAVMNEILHMTNVLFSVIYNFLNYVSSNLYITMLNLIYLLLRLGTIFFWRCNCYTFSSLSKLLPCGNTVNILLNISLIHQVLNKLTNVLGRRQLPSLLLKVLASIFIWLVKFMHSSTDGEAKSIFSPVLRQGKNL